MSEKLTSVTLQALKGQRKITSVTAYDYFSARMAEAAEIDFILVGDSMGMVLQGHKDTLKVEVPHMIYHSSAVRRGAPKTYLVTDMPWMSFHISVAETLKNASRLIKDGAAEAVKIEGGIKRQVMIEACVNAEIPVMAHIGLTPQSINTLGGFKIQKEKQRLIEDAKAVEAAGAFAVVLESIPSDIAGEITDMLSIPTIGIGAGVNCDGQILVWHDLLGINDKHLPFFVKKYSNFYETGVEALKEYAKEVKNKEFPEQVHSYSDLKFRKNTL